MRLGSKIDGIVQRLGILFTLLIPTACAPMIDGPGPAISTPELTKDAIIAADGTRLALRSWLPETSPPKAVILALHGFNDYSNFFDDPGIFLAQRYALASYAYDQRGFGEAKSPGTWAGVKTYVEDAKVAIELLKQRHNGVPLFVLGESMGGAVAMTAMASSAPPEVNGTILSAPAVWGRITMPWYQRFALWLGANTLPWMTLTGQGLNIKPSDNIEMLIELGRDPLIIKETRIGTIYGLVNLMDAGLESAAGLKGPALILYGEKDEIVPKIPTAMMIERLPKSEKYHQRIALYEGGYHMLLRDLPAATVWKDIAAWISNPDGPLPSKSDKRDLSILTKSD